MTRHPINFHRLRADHFSNVTSAIFCRALAAWILNSNHVSLFIHPFSHLWFGERVIFITFYLDMVSMQCVSRHGSRWNVILWGDVVPIDCLQYWTILSGCDSFNGPMTSFHNSVSTRWVGTSKPQMHVPIPRKSLLGNAVSLSVSISIGGPRSRKTFSNCRITVGTSCRRSGRHIANLEGPQSMIVRKFSPLWWVMSIDNLFQLSATVFLFSSEQELDLSIDRFHSFSQQS